MIQTGSYGIRPSRKTWSHKYSGSTVSAASKVNVQNQSRLAIIKQKPWGQACHQGQSWWKRGDVDACAAQTNMQCWVHQDTLFNDKQVAINMREAWEHEVGKDEMNIVLQGLEQHFWRGTKAGWIGCYDFPGETWAGDGSVHKCVMGAGSVCLQRPGCNLLVRVGREEEGVSSLRPEPPSSPSGE